METDHKRTRSETETQELDFNGLLATWENNKQPRPTSNDILTEDLRDPSTLYNHSGPRTTNLSLPLHPIQTRVWSTGPPPKGLWYIHQTVRR